MKPQILRGLRFLFHLVVSEAFLFPVSCCAVVAPVLGYRTLRVAVVPLAFWRSAGVPGAMWFLLLGLAAVCAGGRQPAREAR